jgi:Zn-dependent peptidase ImmA (M78 family)
MEIESRRPTAKKKSQEMESPFEVAARNMASAPIPVEKIIAELGINYAEEHLPDEDSGMITRVDSAYFIVINEAHPKVRRRFTAAHELGHYVYHRDLIGDGVVDDAAYRSTTSGRYANSRIKPWHEAQANKFAVNLLMPLNLLRKTVSELRLEMPRDVSDLAKKFQVSEQALRIRLEALERSRN